MIGFLSRNAVALGVAAAAYALAVGLRSSDPDLYWHLASGRWMLEHRALLTSDVFTYTIAGQPYSVGEWLGQLGLTLAYQAASWPGIAVLRAALVAVCAFFLVRLALRLGAPPLAAVVVSILALLLSIQSWGDRPQLFSIALFPLVLDLCFAARAGERRALWLLPALVLLWTNLHGGYALGLFVIAAFAAEALLLRRPVAPAFGVAFAVSLAASLLDPGALGLASAAAHVLRPPRSIVEEMPPDVLRPAGLLFAGFVIAIIGGALARSDRANAVLEALLVLPILFLSLSAQRHMHWLAFAASPFVTQQAGDLLERIRIPPLPDGARAALAVALFLGAALSTAGAPRAPDPSPYPVAASDALRGGSGNLLHEYDWGGWLIFTHPERQAFIDGRLFPFIPRVIDDYIEMTELRPRWREALDRYAIREVLLRPHRPLVSALRALGWTVVTQDTRFALLRAP